MYDCMGGELGYLLRIAAIGWVGYYPMTWLGFSDVRRRLSELRSMPN